VRAAPTVEAVLTRARVLSADPLKAPLTADFRHDLPRMAAACTEKTGLVYICNPNNPTGTIVTGDELTNFAAKVPPSAAILVDEAYYHFVEDPRYRTACDLIEKFPNIVVARTFSKVYGMAGVRVGYAGGLPGRHAARGENATFNEGKAALLAEG